MKFLKKLQKEFNSLDMWVKCLLLVCILVLGTSLIWPKPLEMYINEHFSNENEIKEALDNGKPTFAVFGAEWCGYCKKLKPVWKNFKSNFKSEKYNAVWVDSDKNKELHKKHEVTGYPTIKFLPNGLNSTDGSIIYENERSEEAFNDFLDKQ